MGWSFQDLLAAQGRVGPPSRRFLTWPRRHAIPDLVADVFRHGILLQYSIDPRNDPHPPNPLLYTAPDLIDFNSPSGSPVPLRDGLLVIGAAEADPIAVDVRDRIGEVGFLCHETYSRAADVRKEYIDVADSLHEFARLVRTGQVPLDSFVARRVG